MPTTSQGRPTFYIDANPLIDFLEHPIDVEPAKTVAAMIQAAEDKRIDLVTSVLTIAEVFKAKHELDGKALDPTVQRKIEGLWHPDASPIRLVEVSELIAREANALLRRGMEQGWAKTKGADAIHLVTATRERATVFLSSEKASTKWGDVYGFRVCRAYYLPGDEAGPPDLFQPVE